MKNTQRVVILRGGVGARERERGHAMGVSHPWRIQERRRAWAWDEFKVRAPTALCIPLLLTDQGKPSGGLYLSNRVRARSMGIPTLVRQSRLAGDQGCLQRPINRPNMCPRAKGAKWPMEPCCYWQLLSTKGDTVGNTEPSVTHAFGDACGGALRGIGTGATAALPGIPMPHRLQA